MGDLDAIAALLERYAAAWAANDPALLAACWDTEDAEPFYKAEEIEAPFASRDQLLAYWEHNRGFNDVVRLSFTDLRVKSLALGLSLALFRMRWDIRFASDATLPDGSPFASRGKAMGGDNHVAAIAADGVEGPRFRAWIEAPDAPIAYMRKLYEGAARL